MITKTKYHVVIIVNLCLVFAACQQNAVEKNKPEPNVEREKLVKLNQFYLKEESKAIKSYIQRRNWNMKRTDSGLWYEIQNSGNGKKLHEGETIHLRYKLELLDGSLCYSSDSTGIKEIVIGKGQIETGLAEALENLSQNGKGRFILPAHLAFGVSGDGKCIPPRSAIVYHIEVLSN